VVEIWETEVFASWFGALRNPEARGRILARIRRLSLGNPGDVRPVGEGVSELRIHYGPGYRVYYVRQGHVVYVLLCGGDKGTQSEDIATAKSLARQLKE
jgi:putative addiction module killer protein